MGADALQNADALQIKVRGNNRGGRGTLFLAALVMPLLLGACATIGIGGKAKPADIHYYYDDIFNTYDVDMRITPTRRW